MHLHALLVISCYENIFESAINSHSAVISQALTCSHSSFVHSCRPNEQEICLCFFSDHKQARNILFRDKLVVKNPNIQNIFKSKFKISTFHAELIVTFTLRNDYLLRLGILFLFVCDSHLFFLFGQ